MNGEFLSGAYYGPPYFMNNALLLLLMQLFANLLLAPHK